MTFPRTRLTEATSDFERELLQSWGDEKPSDRARAGALAAMGIGAKIGTAGAASASSSAAGAGVAKLGTLPFAVVTGAKLLVAGALAVSAVGVTLEYAPPPAQRAPHAVPPMATATATHAHAKSIEPRGAEVLAPAPSVIAHASSPTSTLPESSAPAWATPAPAAIPEEPHAMVAARSALLLGEQVEAIDRARSMLASGDADGALRKLDAYDRDYPTGLLAEEATALRIEALVARGAHGDATAAAAMGDRFLAAHPASPHAAHVRHVLNP